MINKNTVIISGCRYERKFLITELSKYEVENILKLHPAVFFEIYNQRFVNNIYFDSISLKNYYDNIEGAGNRMKIRVRWYGELFGYIKNPILEIKIKHGLLGKKISVPIKPFELKEYYQLSTILNSIDSLREIMMIDLKALKPILLNRYSRIYYQSYNKYYRITIDTNQVFYLIKEQNNSFLNKISDNNTVILELKYDQLYDSGVNCITSQLPFRITKSSKYVAGIQKIFNSIIPAI